MTNDLLIYDGRGDEWFRVVAYRSANQGERYVAATQPFEVLTAKQKRWASASYVVEPCSPPPPSKEWLDLRDAAKDVVAIEKRNLGQFSRGSNYDRLDEALAALPTTEPEPRYTVHPSHYFDRTSRWAVVETTEISRMPVLHFDTERDAEIFAAYMNDQEANQ